MEKKKNETPKALWQKTAEKWPSEFVARTEIEKFTGGLYKGKTFANKADEFELTIYRFPKGVAFNKWELSDFLTKRTKVEGI